MPRIAYWAIAFLPTVLSQATTDAICTVSSLSWAYNSLADSPCQVASSLAAVCNGGEFELQALEPGYVYLGPSRLVANSCRCSSVYYSVLSACAACQGNEWLNWSQYNANCTTAYPGTFPQGIPAGTRVPGWAYADVRATDGFNLTVAQSLESRPESTGIGSPTSSLGFPTRTSLTFSRPTVGNPTFGGPTFGNPTFTNNPTFAPIGGGSSSSGASSHAGAIAGGIIGGVVGLSLIAGLAFFYIRHRNRAGAQPTSSAFNTTSYTPAPYNPDLTHHMSYNPDPNAPYLASQQTQPHPLYDPSNASLIPGTSAPVPSSPYTNTSSPAPATYASFHSSSPQIPQPHIPTPTTAGHYTGAPEV